MSPNTFLKGGAGDDALQVSGGSNVLDGGGSNFFVGGGAADGGRDIFFVDASNGSTWSTIVNFHPGDAVALFGFQERGNIEKLLDPAKGAAGYQGVTLTAAAGLGPPAVAIVTFAGVSLADAQSKFILSTGNTGGVGYLYVAYTA